MMGDTVWWVESFRMGRWQCFDNGHTTKWINLTPQKLTLQNGLTKRTNVMLGIFGHNHKRSWRQESSRRPGALSSDVTWEPEVRPPALSPQWTHLLINVFMAFFICVVSGVSATFPAHAQWHTHTYPHTPKRQGVKQREAETPKAALGVACLAQSLCPSSWKSVFRCFSS